MSMVVKNIKFLLTSLKASIKSASEYKVSFLINTIFMIINNSLFVATWYVILKNTGSTDTFNFKDIMKLWSISTISYGLTYFLFGGVSYINRYILDGDLDVYLTKPKNVLISVLTSKCRFSACGDLLFGIVVGIFAANNYFELVQILLFGIYGTLFLLSLEIIFRSLTVCIGDTETLVSRVVMNLFTSISTYPIEIFSIGIKIITFTIIPAYYAVHLPLEIIREFSLVKTLIVIFSGIVFTVVSVKVFNNALKRYESGNNISMRM